MYYRLGVNKEPEILGLKTIALTLLAKTHIGPYHKIVASLNEVENFAKKNKISCPSTFGEFMDNPELLAPGRLKSHVGCVLKSTEDLNGLKLPEGIYIIKKKPLKYLALIFTGSPAIGPMKVYPQAKSWQQGRLKAQSEGVIEIYNKKNSNDEVITEYYFPVTEN